MLVKSPFNYIGNKFKLLDQLQPCFPSQINTFVDLFCGGCDVVTNVSAKTKYANDLNYHVIEIMREFQKRPPAETIKMIDGIIAEWGLTKDNQGAFEAFRDHYNENPDPLRLYVLMCYSFNYQFRFNSAHKFNNPFGRDRSSFTPTMRSNLLNFIPRTEHVEFTALDFREFDLGMLKEGDFVYADPPYTLTTGSYNDGKRGFKGWSSFDDVDLTNLLGQLSQNKVKFALSNVIEHKGKTNHVLVEWAQVNELYITEMNWHYNNCNYHNKNKHNVTREVLITNYETPRSNQMLPVQGELFLEYC